MNATELFLKDGRPADVFFCGQCRLVKRTQAEAEQCCKPDLCERCGKETGRQYWKVCDACQSVKNAEKERERFTMARKVNASEYKGWVFLEGTGRDGFHESLEDFRDDFECNSDVWDAKPEYVWACKPDHFAYADLSDITERIGERGWEDFDPDTLNGLPELKAAIAKFNEANASIVTYQPDYSTAVLLTGAGRLGGGQ